MISTAVKSIQTSALKKKGLRHDHRAPARRHGHSNVRPEEEGIKTQTSMSCTYHAIHSNVRPEEEGIKTIRSQTDRRMEEFKRPP